MEKKRIYPENTPPGNIPYNVVNPAFRYRAIVPADDSIIMEVDANGVLYVSSSVQRVATPTITFSNGSLIAVCDTEGADIYYTADRSMPTINSTLYTDPIPATADTEYRFVAVKNGYVNSIEASIVLPTVSTPVIVCSNNSVTITCDTPGAAIYYTTDGSVPTTESILYVEPFHVEDDLIEVRAAAFKTGFFTSEVISATRLVAPEVVLSRLEEEIFMSVQGGSLEPTDLEIYYTYDGSTPSKTNGYLYSAPIRVTPLIDDNEVRIFKFVAESDNYLNSSVVYASPLNNFYVELDDPKDSVDISFFGNLYEETGLYEFYYSTDGEHYYPWDRDITVVNQDVFQKTLDSETPRIYFYGANTFLEDEKNSSLGKFYLKGGHVHFGGNILSLVFGNLTIKNNLSDSKITFYELFKNQIKINGSIVIPITEPTEGCFVNMLSGCSGLSSVTVLAKSWPEGVATGWLNGAAGSGVFRKFGDVSIPAGDSGIPPGWTVINL